MGTPALPTTRTLEAMRNSPPEKQGTRFFGYLGVVVALSAILLAVPWIRTTGSNHPLSLAFWLMAVLAVATDTWPLAPPMRRMSAAVFPSICFTFAILLTVGLIPAVVVQSAAVALSSWRLRHKAWRAMFNIAQYAIALSLAAVMLHAGQGILAAMGSAVVWFLTNYAATATAVWLRFGGEFWRVLSGPVVFEALSTGALLLLGTILAAASTVNALLVPLAVVPLIAVQRLSMLSNEQGRLAREDPLTGLVNRKVLMGEVDAAAAEHAGARAGDSTFALLLLDLDRFKHVNDALGHEVGDRLLIAVADRLAAAGRPRDVVARLGGDEFAILAPGLADAGEARSAAERITEALSAPVILDGLPLDVCGSVGIAIYPEHGTDFATLMRHADVAMYDAKHRGDGVAMYVPECDQNTPRRLALVGDLRRALESPDRGGLSVHYQPQVEISSGEVVGVEALLRWRHPVYGPVEPDELIKAAEPSAVMRQLTRWVLGEAIGQLARWRDLELEVRCAVNVSVRDLHNDEIVAHVTDLLRKHGVSSDQILLEITEEALMADPHRVLTTLAQLHGLGVAIALDDFGTGYSSLQHLRRLPLAEVKIDRSFVLGMADDADDAAIVRSIIELAGALGLRVVAEGVEDERLWRLLHQAGCEAAQGWFYARPMPAEELQHWLTRTDIPVADRPSERSVTALPGGPGRVAASPTPVATSTAPSPTLVATGRGGGEVTDSDK